MRRISGIMVFLVVVLGLMLPACTEKKHTTSKPIVMVSIQPIKYFVEQIADTLVDVRVMVPPGSSPEMFEPTPGQMVDLSNADIYFAIGLLDFEKGLEPKLKDQLKVRYVNLSGKADLIKEGTDEHDSVGGHHHGVDPHIWMSVEEVRKMSMQILQNLQQLYPAHSDFFSNNYIAFGSKLDSLKEQVNRILGKSSNRAFLVYHPALGYYAREFGLRQISIEQEGKNPSLKGVVDVVDQARRLGVSAVLSQSQFDIRNAQVIADELNLRVVKVDPLAEDWENSMLHIARAISGEHDE
ncbi:MAG TPA: zinc ABC transporter substrate-binding protein [Tenuifilaceae bacterium]|nr:zinc ABC transporter substrate-binding protein [Tenuifilaceae bacterium]HQM06113.1 zinc ABC transporter substrate-binding protein [Tenuifilaceae bacterium]